MRRAALSVVVVLATLAATVGVPAAAASAGPTVPVPASIDATGGADVTDALLTFFRSVPDGAVVEFPAQARYRIEGTLYLADRHDLTIDGNGAEFFATTDGARAAPPGRDARTVSWFRHLWPRHRGQWFFHLGSNITLRDVVVRGAAPNAGKNGPWLPQYEEQNGVHFAGVTGALLEGCSITDVYGDFVDVAPDQAGTGRLGSDITIRDCHFERSGRQGITVYGAEDVVVEGNYVGDVRRSVFDIEPPSYWEHTRRVRIADNDVGPFLLSLLANWGGSATVEDITFAGNRVPEGKLQIWVRAPEGSRRRNFRVIGNTAGWRYGGSVAPMWFVRADGVEVRDNHQAIGGPEITPNYSGIAVIAEQSCVAVGQNSFPGVAQPLRTDGWPCANAAPLPNLTITPPPSGPVRGPSHILRGTTGPVPAPLTLQAFRQAADGSRVGTAVATATPARTGEFTLRLPLQVNRANGFLVEGVDATGAVTPTRSLTVVEDSAAPVVAIGQPRTGGDVGASPRIGWTVEDAHPGRVDVAYRMAGSASGRWQPIASRAGGSGRLDWRLPAAVRHGDLLDVRITATDRAGNAGSATVGGVRVDRQAPRLLRAERSGSRSIVVSFSEPVTAGRSPSGFSVAGGPRVVAIRGSARTLTLTLGGPLPSLRPRLSYRGAAVRDRVGNPATGTDIVIRPAADA